MLDIDAPVHAWQVLQPPVQPFDGGHLDVGDGHAVHWSLAGHPRAPAALFVHGGPGAGCRDEDRRWFDPQRWRIVLFDQRGCGRSTAVDDLQANTTAHLVADMEALREHLGIERWMLVGGSWGATLALAYAQAHPQRVRGLVLRGVFLGTDAERNWLYGPHGAARRHPQAWQRLGAALGVAPGARLLDVAHERLRADDAAARAVARAWWRWEDDLMDAETCEPVARPRRDDAQALRAARVGVHYARAGWFLDEGQLLREAARLHSVPGIIVQGQRDLVTPPTAARALHAAWPGARLQEVPDAGHASTQPALARRLVDAIDTLAPASPGLTPEETLHVASPRL